jgi:hypothetical protein
MDNQPPRKNPNYDIPGIINTTMNMAASPVNIKAGFLVSGISLFNRSIFTEAEFMPAYSIDRPAPVLSENLDKNSDTEMNQDLLPEMPPMSPQPSTSRQTTMTPEPDASPSTNTLRGSRSSPVIKNVTPSCSKRVRLIKDATPQAGLSGLKKNCAKSVRTPEQVRPLRKAGPRQVTKKG